jgi:hypothetical protein
MSSSEKSNFSQAALLGMEGNAYLARGETDVVREKHKQAGDLFLSEINNPGCSEEKNFLLFLAFTQYYKGGHYQLAADIIKQIDRKKLDKRYHRSLTQSKKDIKLRNAPNYLQESRELVINYMRNDQNQEVIDFLIEHPFIYTQVQLALIRSYCCLKLEDKLCGMLFLRESMRYVGLEDLLAKQ